ncbi:MAG: DUF2110 family protein [Candidatus Bathycorpusculaceae bacterium]
MPKITLSVKVYSNFQTEIVNKILKKMFKDLNVNAKVVGATPRGFIQVAISGEDENVAIQYLADEIGICPENLGALKKFSTLKGRIMALGESKSEIYIDTGVYSPAIIDAIISLQNLQAQLADGRKIALKKLIELFGFCENLPLTIKILSIDQDKKRIKATLSEKQLNKYRSWTKSLLDRLIIVGLPDSEIKRALKEAALKRDVIAVEPLGFFEHAITCKFGTDAAGLIAKVGRKLPSASLTIFSPRKILEFFGKNQPTQTFSAVNPLAYY